ncbi:MAG TPA: UDP-N-acetylmuramoyl-L-alanyl-D-glutamate--2,6-diaminopimelate ligase [Acidimicrobiales bacterium]|nr:UDP-N-acetylmuramoyl-L-alanyl-D-glutamate--2,6-diaminopimelate ligase [Acidimicrobiales bacterium]HLN43377.1 UDP-N-acetylmuramoyl-L-alanyl-D-glutamate--2,6-diaminopimelate ligase [Acidimicrobiales bacterium]
MDRLLEEVEVIEGSGDPARTEVTSIEFDSRHVSPGALFCCLPGREGDGHDHAAEAVARGAAALLVERRLALDVTQAVVAPGTARRSMARVACAFFGQPARSLLTVGVTGTNGKTTVTHLLASIFEAHRWPTTVIGTLDGARTTPESPVLQRLLAEARDRARRAVAMEVSSHALAQARVDGIRFDAAVFTNLSHDHLDYHGTADAYFAAKASLFTPERAAMAVVNVDDPRGRWLLEAARVPTVGFTMAEAGDVRSTPRHTSFTWRGRRVEMALAGSFHVANALAAATTAAALGVPEDMVQAGLQRAAPVPGRFEVVETGAPFTVVVDYAHTPDGLRVLLDSARVLAGGHRVLCAFGCGGDRDREKRPLMGAIAAGGADVVVVTSDNSRHEDPDAIIAQVLAGVPDGSTVMARPERADAIELVIGLARPGDVVVVAGKGHETEIEIGAERRPFDDRQVAAAAVSRLSGKAGAGAGDPP